MSAKITIYGAEWCPPCHMAKNYLKSKGIEYDYVNVDEDQAAGRKIIEETGWQSIPIIKIGDEFTLGFDRPRLDELIAKYKLG